MYSLIPLMVLLSQLCNELVNMLPDVCYGIQIFYVYGKFTTVLHIKPF